MKYLKKIKTPWLFAIAIIFSLILEFAGFQLDGLLLKWSSAQTTVLDLSTFPGFDGVGIPVLPEEGTYSFNGLDIFSRNVMITVSGSPEVQKGTLSLCDEASALQTAGAAHFLVNPGSAMNSFTVRLNSRGNLTRLRINFEEQENPIWIIGITFNHATFQLSYARILLFFAVTFLTLLILKYELYREILDFDRSAHKLMAASVLLFCLTIALIIFYKWSPSHTYLQPLPTDEDLHSYEDSTGIVDAYAQQLDAFEKGQLHLDLDINPELLMLDKPYDKGERDKNNVSYHWDRAFYNGKYYSYFGLAPLFMIYYPVYWTTGMLPTAFLVLPVLSIFAILGAFFALNGLLHYFHLRTNLLLYLLGVPALISGSLLYLLESSSSFYYYPVLSGIGWLGVFLGFSFYACKQNKFSPLFFLDAGISVVMIVLSRPNILLLAIVFVLPAYLKIILDKQLTRRQKVLDVLPFLIPVIIGAIGTCWYNYARFDSITEFGTTYQLTESDIHYNSLVLSFHHLKGMLYHYFAEPLNRQEFFPFLDLVWEKCFDYGNYLYYECNAGLLNLPLNFGLFLIGWTCLSKTKKAPLQKITYTLILLGILILGYVDYIMAGVHIRYVADLSLAVSLLALLLIFEHISFTDVKSGQILYGLTVVILLATIVTGILLIFANETKTIENTNPDFFIQVARLLRNW